MAEGIAAAGDFPAILRERDYQPNQVEQFDCCCFYGLEGNMPTLFRDFSAASAAVYVDLGYWGRREGGRWAGFHKLSVSDRHPTAYFQTVKHPADRLARFHVEPKPLAQRGPDAPILLAGMGDKGALAEGFQPEQWERAAIAVLRSVTSRPIVYRPKPSWKTAKPIHGVAYSPRTVAVEEEIAKAWAVVTHHSNVAVDALVAGVPAFCWSGVATPLASQNLMQIERSPDLPSVAARKQWMADIAYTQWNIAEMRSGAPWQHLKREGLIP